MTPPRIEQSTKEERLAFVLNQWKCLSNCEICGKCSMLRGRNEEMLYADYIDGKRHTTNCSTHAKCETLGIALIQRP